mmetsp:Transcript_33519/g.6078  ORF Transcript_33519/g.6078 Transcript_33519/m.6078 type:complete len:142 (-) Transcript_33519:1069-1494(-)|eukprot:CAMPEP_0168313512 /NCGR_PEP_ID=MMETSP0210-20121227/2452_1 /TAXON_ID=40633 /ORGANISM="Condylostoma magnum, Strain COL2" /LENGTH=141 /DNA_ID=CAMNT_0008271017 /DNA_START=384 /DNA_END=809 /DNA_ORIENTATION=-
MSMHPMMDILISGGGDSVGRVWDIRTKSQVRVLEGHRSTIFSLDTQGPDPQAISGSADSTVKLWDLGTGRAAHTLTRHKKGVRDLRFSEGEYTFVTAGSDNIRQWKCPEGKFMRNFNHSIGVVNCVNMNSDGVMVAGSNEG